ncbi:hypothetical protein SpiGrapes_1390 [Sphaerochaeta pleomorpha str. Grapes]|uniref:Periplasmic/secreted protein n=1 Tax=Sphaerochaeta pleomorpha (strain ATCC BAA-1885 / DSM 22778 / Grapes) TaxID=158190 RepID=G8QUG8_SPHPG|nr:SIMPL domain-containing protein [Sphaerochaeta pleomorpha]AEV29201.1 hypothetical protein SpiGrapes_1390 [Sphaerochaeta pleomorpha str. Grapes]
MKRLHVLSYCALSMVLVLFLSSCMSAKGGEPGLVRTIEISGSGEVVLQPDIATFSIQVSERAPTTSEAQAFANAKMAELLTVLRSNSIAEKDISTTSLNLRPEYEWVDNKQFLAGQVASQSLSVTLRDLPLLGSLIDQLGSVSSIQLDSVRFDKEDKSAAIQEARKKAVDEAFEKAEMYAKSSNMKVGRPISITESSFASNGYSVRAKVMMASESFSAGTEVPSGSMTVSATISMVLEMF